MRIRLVANSRATRSSPALLEAARSALARVADVEVVATGGPRDAERLAAEVEEGAVVAFGGDGTVNEVVNGLRPGVALGIVPAGASSIFARQLGLGADPRRALPLVAEAVAAGSLRRATSGPAEVQCRGRCTHLGYSQVLRLV
jgi:diacylglycerol kinase family enzyme